FPFGGLTASVGQRSDGAIIFELMSRDFPLKVHPIAVVEDLPPSGPRAPDAFGQAGRVWFGAADGLKAYARADLDADAQSTVSRVLDGMRHDALAAFEYRAAAASGQRSRERYDQMRRLERALRRTMQLRRDQVQAVSDLAEHLAPNPVDVPVTLADVYAVPPTD